MVVFVGVAISVVPGLLMLSSDGDFFAKQMAPDTAGPIHGHCCVVRQIGTNI